MKPTYIEIEIKYVFTRFCCIFWKLVFVSYIFFSLLITFIKEVMLVISQDDTCREKSKRTLPIYILLKQPK